MNHTRNLSMALRQKWDVDNIVNKNLDGVSVILNGDKPTAVRQALGALRPKVEKLHMLIGESYVKMI